MNRSDIRMREYLCRRLSAARRRQKYEPGLKAWCVARATCIVYILSQVKNLLLNIGMECMKGKIEAEHDGAQSGFHQL